MARFGDPEDLLGAVLWLLSPASAFVTGVVLPIDGGFAAYQRRLDPSFCFPGNRQVSVKNLELAG